MGFWDGVQTILLGGDGIAFLLPDNRLVSAAEMERRERAYKAGRAGNEPLVASASGSWRRTAA